MIDECAGVRLARRALYGRPRPPAAQRPYRLTLRVGSYAMEVPATGVQDFAAVWFALAARVQPTKLDTATVESTAGALVVDTDTRCDWLVRFGVHADSASATDLALAFVMVDEDATLRAIDQARRARIEQVYQAAADVEAKACQYLGNHLARTRQLAGIEHDRYLQTWPGGAAVRAADPDYRGLVTGLQQLAALRRRSNLAGLARKQAVLTVVGLALTVLAVADAGVTTGPDGVDLDRRTWDRINDANNLTKETDRRLAEATTDLLREWSRLAQLHPLLLVLDHEKVADYQVMLMADALQDAIRATLEAADRLQAANRAPVVPQTPPSDGPMQALVRALADADDLSVWKLPFFVARALPRLPAADAQEVTAVLADVAESAQRTAAIHAVLQIAATTVAGVLVALTGPAVVPLSFLLASAGLGWEHWQNRPARVLWSASLDPETLLRGRATETVGLSTVGVAAATPDALAFARWLGLFRLLALV